MGNNQCTGDRDYFSEQESARSRELNSRPVVVPHADTVLSAAARGPLTQRRTGNTPMGMYGMQQTSKFNTDTSVASSAASARTTSTLSSTSVDSSVPLMNASGAFLDPTLIDKFYDVSVSHVILNASPDTMHRIEAAASGAALTLSPRAPLPPRPAAVAAAPAWQKMLAVPYPPTTTQTETGSFTLPPLPFATENDREEENEKEVADAASASPPTAAAFTDVTALNSLRWKPSFSSSVTSLQRPSHIESDDPATAAREAAKRKAARRVKRMEKEERRLQAIEEMKMVRTKLLAGAASTLPPNIQLNMDLKAATVNQRGGSVTYEEKEYQHHQYQQQQQQRPHSLPPAQINYSYQRDDNNKQAPAQQQQQQQQRPSVSSAPRQASAPVSNNPVRTPTPNAARPVAAVSASSSSSSSSSSSRPPIQKGAPHHDDIDDFEDDEFDDDEPAAQHRF